MHKIYNSAFIKFYMSYIIINRHFSFKGQLTRMLSVERKLAECLREKGDSMDVSNEFILLEIKSHLNMAS